MGREVELVDMTAVPVTSQEPPLPPPPSFFPLKPTGAATGHTHLKPARVYCFPAVVPGSSCSRQESWAPRVGGQEVQELSKDLRDVGPVERQASLEYTEVGNFYIYIFVCADLYSPSCHSVGVNVLSVMCARIEFM